MATPTISEYTSHLREDKSNMRNYLNTIGIETKESDTFTELTKAVDKIRTQAPYLYTQEEEPAVKQGIWLKGSNIVVNKVFNDTDLYFKEELTYCGDNQLTAKHNNDYQHYLYSEGKTYLLTFTNTSDSNDFTLYKINPITLALEFVVRVKTGANCILGKAFIRKNVLHLAHIYQTSLTYFRFDITTGERLSDFLFDTKYYYSSSKRAWSSNAIYNEKYDVLFVGEANSNGYSYTYLHRYDFETEQYTVIKHPYGTRQSNFKLHAHPECIIVNGSYYKYDQPYTNIYKIGSNTMTSLQSYGSYGVNGFSNSAVLGGKTYLDVSNKCYSVFDYDVATDKFYTKHQVYWKEDKSALNPTITTIIPLIDRLIFLNPASSNYTYYSFGGIDKTYPDKTLVLFQGNQISTAKFSTQLMPSVLLSGKVLVTPYNAIYYYTDEYGYNSPYPIYYGNGKRWVPVVPRGSEDTNAYEPLLQNKSIEITENGTTTITADANYDGLNSISVTTNVPNSGGTYIEDCSELFNESSNTKYSLITKILPCCKPTNAYKMFYNNKNISGTFDVTSLDISQCTTCESMFEGMSNVTSFDVSNFNTSACTNMQAMFIYFGQRNTNANKLDLSSFNTTNVTNMSYMFFGNDYIAEIDLSSFDFTNVTNFSKMFTNCGISCSVSAGAYADGIPYIYVKDEAAQNWILTTSNDRPSTWSTANVIIKEV